MAPAGDVLCSICHPAGHTAGNLGRYYPAPNGRVEQVARNLTDADSGALLGQRYVLHDRDTKFCARFRSILSDESVEPLRLPPKSPDLNAFAERWVRFVKQECLSKLILFR